MKDILVAVPGVEWCSGSLGQGLSVGGGFALAARLRRLAYHVFVVMGDGEQAKGQLQEAREFALKFKLDKLTAIVDCNGLQASGALQDIMPQDIAGKYRAAGWRVLDIDGHDYQEMYGALRACYTGGAGPTVILARTVMGKGVAGIESRRIPWQAADPGATVRRVGRCAAMGLPPDADVRKQPFVPRARCAQRRKKRRNRWC